MSIPVFKRRPTGMEYVENAYELQGEIMNLVSKLSARWARVYMEPIDRLACMQADFVNMANSINPKEQEDYITRRWLLIMSRACLNALEKRLMDMTRVLYMNPIKCFTRKNGKHYTYTEATNLLDKKIENLGVNFARQYDLIKGVLASDSRKYKEKYSNCEPLSEEEIIKIMVSKGLQTVFGIPFEIGSTV